MRATITRGALDRMNAALEVQSMFVAVMKVLMSSNGFVINSAIDGSIQMKPLAQFASAASNCTASVPESAFRSYLMGNPELKLALNEAVQVVFACSVARRNSRRTSWSRIWIWVAATEVLKPKKCFCWLQYEGSLLHGRWNRD